MADAGFYYPGVLYDFELTYDYQSLDVSGNQLMPRSSGVQVNSHPGGPGIVRV